MAECKPDPSLAYFGNDDVRYGPGIQVELSKHSSSELDLFKPGLPSQAINAASFFQPDAPIDPTVVIV